MGYTDGKQDVNKLGTGRVAVTSTMAVAFLLAMASLAWACTLHVGTIWFCATGTTCTNPNPVPANNIPSFAEGNFSVLSNALLGNATYVIHYGPLPGGSNPVADVAFDVGTGPCNTGALLTDTSGTTLKLTTDLGGSFPSNTAKTPPGGVSSVRGITYEACAQPISKPSTGTPEVSQWPAEFSDHTVFTIT